MERALAKLQGAPMDQWQDADVETYLHSALFVVYLGAIKETRQSGRFPTDVTSILSGADLNEFPPNPFDGFRPMKVLSLSDTFSPGDLVLQVAPSSHWSGLRNPAPWSFVLSVYAPTTTWPKVGSSPLAPNDEWAVAPQGAMYSLPFFRQTTAQTQEKIRKAQEARDAAERDQAQPTN